VISVTNLGAPNFIARLYPNQAGNGTCVGPYMWDVVCRGILPGPHHPAAHLHYTHHVRPIKVGSDALLRAVVANRSSVKVLNWDNLRGSIDWRHERCHGNQTGFLPPVNILRVSGR
jgi:hypothetical protein